MENIQYLREHVDFFINSKYNILHQWVHYTEPAQILDNHKMDTTYFVEKYASGVFDYFIGVIQGERDIGNCPVMQDFLVYLKDREISADELFELCSHFRRSMIDFSYDAQINSKEMFDEISYLFDKNFRGILKYYTDAIFQKLIDARQEAVMASQAKEYFLSNMSHEIRTPLNAILGFVSLLLDDELSKKQRNYLEIILNSGENLLNIINDILDFSKLRSGEFTIEPREFSIHEELAHTMELFVASADLKEIDLTAYIDPDIPKKLHADILRVKQIVSNFLSNAIKFTQNGGHVHVEARYVNQMLSIFVEDNGIGISQEDQENIFQAFAQAQYAKESRSDGTGLGLSISYQLAELMGGMVGVSSEVGKGSRFWVEIPVGVHNTEHLSFEEVAKLQEYKVILYAKDFILNYKHQSFLRYANNFDLNIAVINTFDTEFDICLFFHEQLTQEQFEMIINDTQHYYIAIVPHGSEIYDNYEHISVIAFPLYCTKLQAAFSELIEPTKQVEHKKQITKTFQGHILVAEDNEANQELVKILLKKFGLSFDMVTNGLEAVEMFQKNKYDLILMDEQMPQMDGTAAVKEIRKIEKLQKISRTPISALTANVAKNAKEEVLAGGYDAFLGKPIILSELEEVLEKYLEVHYEHQQVHTEVVQEKQKNKPFQINSVKLLEELMLTKDELTMLFELFQKKMQTILPQLHLAIEAGDYSEIAKKAHNIKGASGNFRVEFLQENAAKMEEMAKQRQEDFDFEGGFRELENAIKSLELV